MKTRIIIIIAIAAVTIPVLFYVSLLMQVIFIHTEPEMSLEEFHEKFDDEPIVKHFKLTYPEHFTGVGKNPVMMIPAWGYGSGHDSGIMAELRVQENFGMYEFIYTCSNDADTWVSVNIKNPTSEDIDNNLCW